jgi:hypothetical protein
MTQLGIASPQLPSGQASLAMTSRRVFPSRATPRGMDKVAITGMDTGFPSEIDRLATRLQAGKTRKPPQHKGAHVARWWRGLHRESGYWRSSRGMMIQRIR